MISNVEAAIAEVSGVYQSITGKPLEARRVELPPEVDPRMQAETSYRQFKTMLDQKMKSFGMEGKEMPPMPPPVDVLELEREWRICVDLPGVAREQVSVTMTGEALTIRAERGPMRPAVGMMRHEERRKGSYLRSIALPGRVRREGVDASLRDGVLTICIPMDGNGVEGAEMPVDVK